MSNSLTPSPYSTVANIPGPSYPSLPLQALPQRYLDGMINNYGVRLGWMKSHQCPCTYGGDIQGSPDPRCNTCHGRGFFWDAYNGTFTGMITFLHGFGASPDEFGQEVDPTYGTHQKGEPTLTIPYSAQDVWQNASQMDAFLEIDASSRFTTVLTQGESSILPYQQGLSILNVYIFDPVYKASYQATTDQYAVDGASVSLVGFPDGTAYSVEFMASPVYLAWRKAGGLPHARPFGAGAGQIPKRFRLVSLDIWTRARNQSNQGLLTDINGNPIVSQGPGFGLATEGGNSTSPQGIVSV